MKFRIVAALYFATSPWSQSIKGMLKIPLYGFYSISKLYIFVSFGFVISCIPHSNRTTCFVIDLKVTLNADKLIYSTSNTQNGAGGIQI